MLKEFSRETSILDDLRQQIARLEHSKSRTGNNHPFSFGIPEIDASLPLDLFAVAGLHEVIAGEPKSAGAATGFVSTLAHGLASSAAVIWISREAAVHMPGLLVYGLTPQQCFFVHAKNEQQTLQAMEEALRSGAFAVVIGELYKADLTATRRLQLAAEAGSSIALTLRLASGHNTSACMSRWVVQAAPSICEDGIPGIGAPSWHITLDRIKGGTPANWRLCWKDSAYSLVQEIATGIVQLRRSL